MAISSMQTIFFLFICLIVIHTCTALLLHNEEECLALFDFKKTISYQPDASVDFGGFRKLDSWRKIARNESNDYDSDCCLWDGVVCSNKGHVIGLDLGQSSLYGSINTNSSLFNLEHLQMLNLSMNNFVGSQIPTGIVRLKELRSLDLSYSGFSGQIPIEISHLTQLATLDLSWNSLKLHSPSLEYLLQNLTGLEELYLAGVDISSFIPPFLSNFSSLRSLDLQGCGLRDEFPSKLFHLPKLGFVSMSRNPSLTGSLPEFKNNTLLEVLDLSATSFVGIIPESISKLTHLVYLSLLSSYISGCIPRSLVNMTRLIDLGLGQDDQMGVDPSYPKHLSNQPGLKVCDKDWIRKMSNLERLYLAGINIHDEILPSLANLTKLSFVRVAYCHIRGHIPSAFLNLTRLTTIDLRNNNLEGQISSSFSNLKRLERLHLHYNNFSGSVELDTFAGLDKLRRLSLSHNKISFISTDKYNHTQGEILPDLESLGLSSCNLKEFPLFLRDKKKLSQLILANNKIAGLVPDWFSDSTHETLQKLDLSFNLITGFHQDPNFLPWVNMEIFDISNNKLQGKLPIPPQTMIVYIVRNNNLTEEMPRLICEAKSLRLLDLSSNNMVGTLPPCLGNLSDSLSYLDLKENNFHGPMMNTFTNGSAMEYIDLSQNQFTGQVAKTLASCSSLQVLVLGGNAFDDSFPYWLGSLANLQVLILRSNKFYGAIQDLTNIGSRLFLKLRILDLSNNGFNGRLPDKFFQTLNSMKSVDDGKSYDGYIYQFSDSYTNYKMAYSLVLTIKGSNIEYSNRIVNIFKAIDLSCNNFEGQIPQSLSDLHGLQSLNLSNNHFTGHIIRSLGYLSNLESFDLSRNKLSGKIPQELTKLSFLAIFNVSFNHLHGTIPKGNQFSTFDETSYMGNPDLCGELLNNTCDQSSKGLKSNESENHMADDEIDLIIILLGVGSGLVIGIIIGNVLYARYNDWFIERFKLRKDRWVRPLRNRRKN